MVKFLVSVNKVYNVLVLAPVGNLLRADKRWRVTVHRYSFNALLVIYKSCSVEAFIQKEVEC
jgi:hypothetical protein